MAYLTNLNIVIAAAALGVLGAIFGPALIGVAGLAFFSGASFGIGSWFGLQALKGWLER